MPYILHSKRDQIKPLVDMFYRDCCSISPLKGTLNYFIFYLAKKYITNYSELQEFVGELECAKLEIYRQIAGPYENLKIQENGDVTKNG